MFRLLLARSALAAQGGGMVSRRVLIPLVSLLSLLLAMPAVAITYGEADGTLHPNVGALVDTRRTANANAYCTGTLIAPRVFLTAAHCGDKDGEKVKVTFDSASTEKSKLVAGIFHPDPAYRPSTQQSDPHDIAVVIFQGPINGITPALLPAANALSGLPADQQFTAVGYGREEPVNQPGGPDLADPNVRQYAVSTLNATNPAWLRLSQNQATGDGGTCYGDSGGPNFLGAGSPDTHQTIAGITITGDSLCKATNVIYRLDTESARSFLSRYVTVPGMDAAPKTKTGKAHHHKHRQGDHRHREHRR